VRSVDEVEGFVIGGVLDSFVVANVTRLRSSSGYNLQISSAMFKEIVFVSPSDKSTMSSSEERE
jgi:hypothetical protein